MTFFDIEGNSPTKKIDYIWTEKYRPKTFTEYIGNDSVKLAVKGYLDSKNIPHLLFYSTPGTGKTSLAKIIVAELDCDYIYINASDENNVDTVRTKIKTYASTVGFKELKVIILDEADACTAEFQWALRNLMETYSLNTRFILTCNYHQKIIDAIRSRCQVFEIHPQSKRDVALYLKKILDAEKVGCNAEDAQFIIDSYYPDIRKIINFAQQSTVSGNIVISKSNAIDTDFKSKLVDMLKNVKSSTDFQAIRKVIVDADVSSYEEIYKYLYDKLDDFAKNKQEDVILEIADSIYKSSFVFEKEITFLACISRLITILTTKKVI